ncbi:MAG TPA: LamG domain-containing protein [Verrucomicrobiae bacterium]|nr:LamG domain-containing protein [Verrucomicrobiae bacterium]
MKRLTQVIILALFFTAATVFAGAPVRNGLVLYFPTVAARVRDASNSKNNATANSLVVSNSPSLVSMQQTHQLSYCAWINPASIPSEFPVLLSKGGNSQPGAYGGYEFTLNANGDHDLLFQSGLLQAHAETQIINTNLGQWVHVAFTIDLDAQTMQFYVNGEPVNATIDQGTFADVNFDLPNNLYVAERDPAANGNRSNFDGQMREVMLFNRALSADEIQTIFTKTTPKRGKKR